MKNLLGPLVRVLLVAAAVTVGWGLLSAFGVVRPDAAEQVRIAQQALAAGDAELAESMALAVIKEDPKQYDAWVIAGVAAVEREDFETAQSRFDEVPDDESAVAVQARLRSADMLLNKVHRLSAAEDQFRRAYRQQNPPRVGVEQLALLLGISSRYQEQVPFLLELIRDEKFNNLHLYLLHEGRNKPVNPESIPIFLKSGSDDPAAQIAKAGQEISLENFGEAILILRRITAAYPRMAEAHAKLGRALLADGRREEMFDWNRQLSESAEDHPDVWIVRGEFATVLDQPAVAIRCYWEAVRRDPNNEESCLRLGRMLSEETGQAEASVQFQQRAAKLREFSRLIESTTTEQGSGASQAIAELAESLGLIWEAFGWTHIGLRVNAGSMGANDRILRLRKAIEDLPFIRTAPGMNPAEEFDLSGFPLPDWGSTE